MNPSRMNSFLHGFGICIGLIVAIGPQNAFILKQGLKREHILITCLTALICDMILVVAGIGGLSVLTHILPSVKDILTIGGVIFLVAYSLKSFRSAFYSHSMNKIMASTQVPTKRTKVVLTVLAFTFLNPHALLDTVVLIGGAATQKELFLEKLQFAMGTMAASAIWFFALGFGSMKLTQLFKRPITWKILDASIGVMMALLAFNLGRDLLETSLLAGVR